MQAKLENLKPGIVIHGDVDRVLVAVASPVYPAGSQADRSERANREHGWPTYRLILDDGKTMLVHPGNTLFASTRPRA